MASDHGRKCNTNLNKWHVVKENETALSLFSLRGYFHDYRGLISSSQLLQSSRVSVIYPPATLPLWVILQLPIPLTVNWPSVEGIPWEQGYWESLRISKQQILGRWLCLKTQKDTFYHQGTCVWTSKRSLSSPKISFVVLLFWDSLTM